MALRHKFALTDGEMQHLLAQAEHTARGSNDYFRYTSAMNTHFTQAQKIHVVELMWQVAFADAKLHAKQAAGLA